MSRGFIPPDADPNLLRALEEIWRAIQGLTEGDLDMRGRRIVNTGKGISGMDVATIRQMPEILRGGDVLKSIETIIHTQQVSGHGLLSVAHPDTSPGSPASGKFVRGNADLQWAADVIALGDLPNQPSCRVYHSANQTIAGSTATALAFDSESYDTDTMHNTAVNNSRITFTTGGRYAIGCNIDWQNSGLGADVMVSIRLNGATVIGRASRTENAVYDTDMIVTAENIFVAGDYVEVVVVNSLPALQNMVVQSLSDYSPRFWAHRFAA